MARPGTSVEELANFWIGKNKARWPIRKFVGSDFFVVPGSYFKEMFAGLATVHKFADDDEVLLPAAPLDDGLHFPAPAELEDYGYFIRAGIATHELIVASRKPVVMTSDDPRGFTASEIAVLPDDMDWYSECMKVLSAHAWADDYGSPTDNLLRDLDLVAPGAWAEIQLCHGQMATFVIWEAAGRYLAPALSRVWYAANMLALRYVHGDDLTLGFLLCEYRIRMKYEPGALRYEEQLERNRENGRLGGQAEKRRERYRVMEMLAQGKAAELAFASDTAMRRAAKRMAVEYDRSNPVPLFVSNSGRLLNDAWFDQWVEHFRAMHRPGKGV